LFDELWAAARAAGVSPAPPPPAIEFRVWRAGLATGASGAPLASFTLGGTSADDSLQRGGLTIGGAAAADPGAAAAAAAAASASDDHLRALLVPFAAVLQHWRVALSPALADAAGRAPLAGGAEATDAAFGASSAAHAGGGVSGVTLRGAARAPPRDAATLFASPAWAAAFGGRAAVAALVATAAAGGGAGGGLSRAFAPPAARARAAEAAALRDGHAAAWRAFRRAWGHPNWAAGAGAAVRVGRALSADAPRRAAHAAAAAAAAAAGARAWRRLARRLSEAGVLFAGGPGGAPPSALEFWRLDDTEDASRARRRLKRDYNGTDHAGAAAMSDVASAAARLSATAPAKRSPRWSVGGTPDALAVPPARRGGGDALDGVAEEEEEAAEEAEEAAAAAEAEDAHRGARRSTGRLSATTLASIPHAEDDDTGSPHAAAAAAASAAAASAAAHAAAAAAAAAHAAALSDEEPLLRVDATWVTPLAVVPGELILTRHRLTFTPDAAPAGVSADATQRYGSGAASSAAPAPPRRGRAWALSSLLQIHARRYLLRRSALELFFVDRGAAFFDFGRQPSRRAFYKALLDARPPALAAIYADAGRASLLRPASALLRPDLTARWQRRELSNFDYLMELNTLAGRSYNDITQWCVPAARCVRCVRVCGIWQSNAH
jgi:hypothetical protein